MSRTAVIAGASGLVGGYCLRALLDHPRYERVVAVLRRPLPITHEKLHQLIIDFDQMDRIEIPAGADIYCSLGTTIRKAGSKAAFRKIDFEYPKALAEHAANHGAEQFLLVSSVGADARSRNFYLHVKGETERTIGAMSFRAVHIFRPGLLLGARDEHRASERLAAMVMPRLEFLLRGQWQKYRAISAEIVGRAMPAAAMRSERGICVYDYEMIHWLSRRLHGAARADA